MLILSRKRDQEIYIGDDITIKVLGVNKYGQVRLGIEAPKNINITRCDMIKDEIGNIAPTQEENYNY